MLVSWERTTGGEPAQRQEREAIAGPHVQRLAWQAITDVDRIRAAFTGNEIVFEPCLTILAKSHRTAIGWSLLVRDEPLSADDGEPGPDLCLRVCRFDNAKAIRDLQSESNRRERIAASLPLECEIRFFSSQVMPVSQLVEQTAAALSAGIGFESQERVDQGGEIEFRFRREMRNYAFAWFPAICVCPRLERLIARWREFFDGAGKVIDQAPDSRCTVEYRQSVWERLERYS
ncbi:MAG: hypothetical protein EXS05_24235 [Planctomycetaceae bacterium]|nr:hypothetical protein [Planctomycetaceae bacterium]